MLVAPEHSQKFLQSILLLYASSEEFFGAQHDSSVLGSLRFLANSALFGKPKFAKPHAFTLEGYQACYPFPSMDFAFIKFLLDLPEMKQGWTKY